MLLLPLWPQEMRRLPIVAIGLVLANIIVFIITGPMAANDARVSTGDVQSSAQKLTAILLDPQSNINASDRVFLDAELKSAIFPSDALISFLRKTQTDPSFLSEKLRYQWDLVYPVFDSTQRAAVSTDAGESLFARWSFNPQRSWWPGIISHEFLHADWIHLLLNMLFLWISASIAEEIIGVHVIWLYLAGGAAAALAQVEYGIAAGQVLVGASGALSAVMGFCLFARAQAKVRLCYVTFLPLPKVGFFDCPLWFFLPVWLLTQVLMALVTVDKSAVSTAYVAHIAGFAFGCLIGLVQKA